MCQSNTTLQFCTCINPKNDKPIIHNKNSRRYKKQFNNNAYLEQHLAWQLYHYIGDSYNSLIGMMIMPVTQLTQTINNDFVLEQINANHCFDFDYTPSEGDNLIIELADKQKKQVEKSRPDTKQYLSFIYKNGYWEIEYYDAFSDKKEKFQEGKLHINR